MFKKLMNLSGLLLVICGGSATAVEIPKDAKGCMTCHAIDKKVVGPAWQEVAKKYSGDKKAVDTLATHIAAGGKFGWNMGGMPAKGGNMKLTDDQIKEIAKFIVELPVQK